MFKDVQKSVQARLIARASLIADLQDALALVFCAGGKFLVKVEVTEKLLESVDGQKVVTKLKQKY